MIPGMARQEGERARDIQRTDSDPNYSSLRLRQKFQTYGPLKFEPHGPRYHVAYNNVRYFDWEFVLRHSPSSSLQLFDIRFRKERVVYELSVQEVNSVYGRETPGLMRAKFLDSHYGYGKSSNVLVKDVDCPYSATFLHTHYRNQRSYSGARYSTPPKSRSRVMSNLQHHFRIRFPSPL